MAPNAAMLVEEVFAALAAGDVSGVGALLADDIRFSTGGTGPVSGVAEGKAAVFEKLQTISALTGGTGRFELVRATAVGEELALVHARRYAAANGITVEADVAMVVRADAGSIVEVADVMERRLESFWDQAANAAP